MVSKVKKLPKNPRKGAVYHLKKRCYRATGKVGFGKFQITKCSHK